MLLNKNNPSAKRKFQEIRDAYETLQDSEKRAEYNRIFEDNFNHVASDIQMDWAVRLTPRQKSALLMRCRYWRYNTCSWAGNTGGQGSEAGCLYIKLKAIHGDKIKVPTLSGKTQGQIPKGVQPGQLLLPRGKALPKHGLLVNHGDQYVGFQIKFSTGTCRGGNKWRQRLGSRKMALSAAIYRLNLQVAENY